MNFKTQDLARVFLRLEGKTNKTITTTSTSKSALGITLLLCHYLRIYDGHSPITLLITIFRTAVSSGNRTQIGINSVCNHRID